MNCIKNLSAVLFILQKFDAKRPVLRYALTADTSGTPLTLNEIIEFGFRFNEKRNENTKTSEDNKETNESENTNSETNENKNNDTTNNETNENNVNDTTSNETNENKNNDTTSNGSENKEGNSTNENKEISGADSDTISKVSLKNTNQLNLKTRS